MDLKSAGNLFKNLDDEHGAYVIQDLLKRRVPYHQAVDAKDVAFEKLYHAHSQGAMLPRSIREWLKAVAWRAFLDECKRKASEQKSLKSYAESGHASGITFDSSHEETIEVQEAIKKALGLLSPRQIRIIDCKYYCKMSEEEIARTLCVSRTTIRKDLQRALKSLRKTMHEQGIEDG